MRSKRRRLSRRSRFPRKGTLLAVLLGTVGVPTVLSLSVGIVALALWREAFDIVFGVLVLSFAAMVITGTVASFLLLARTTRLAKLRASFVAGVGHELRTPLAGIMLAVETLELGRAETQEERQEILTMLRREVTRLDELVQRVLRWRQIEAGETSEPPCSVSLAEVAHEVVDAFAPLATGHRVRLSCDAEEGLPTVLAVRAQLADALRNLVGNALKFGGDSGAVEVSVRAANGELIVAVRDRGPGIAEAEQERIFEEFYRAPSGGREHPGVGLGLAIASTVIREHGGRLEVDSQPGSGATFVIYLPAEQEDVDAG